MTIALLSMRCCCMLLLIYLALLSRPSSTITASPTSVINHRAWNEQTTRTLTSKRTSSARHFQRSRRNAIFSSSPSSISFVDSSVVVQVLSLRGGAAGGAESQQSVLSKVSSKKRKTRKKRSTQTKKGSVKAKPPPPSLENENEKEEEEEEEEVSRKDEDSDDDEEAEKDQDEKKTISKVLREKDAAQAMGDAIRDRASQFRASSSSSSSPSSSSLLDSIDGSVSSVGWAMGASDRRSLQFVSSFIAMQQQQQQKDQKTKNKGLQHGMEDDEDESGGVETATMSVLVHYFLKSHGGAHALQCVCSLLATMAGWTVITLGLFQGKSASSSNNNLAALSMTLMRRCMLFAMMKHVSGLLAASFLTARAIPQVGLSQARLWMNDLVRDPVSQYVFYAACILLWLPNSTNSNLGGSAWWQAYSLVPALLVGPIVLRETISTMLVISDVLVLWTCSAATSHRNRSPREDNDDDDDGSVEDFDDDGAASSRSPALVLVQAFLRVSTSIVNAIMSILVTPKVWRSATNNVQERQAILAKLTSRASLVLEVLVGLLLVVDAVKSLVAFIFGANSSSSSSGAAASAAGTATVQPSSSSSSMVSSFGSILRRVICTRLYLHYLWLRRRKIERLAIRIRGGASKFPFHVLNVLMDPIAAMGCSPRKVTTNQGAQQKDTGRMKPSERSSRKESYGNTAKNDSKDHEHFTWKEYLDMALSEST